MPIPRIERWGPAVDNDETVIAVDVSRKGAVLTMLPAFAVLLIATLLGWRATDSLRVFAFTTPLLALLVSGAVLAARGQAVAAARILRSVGVLGFLLGAYTLFSVGLFVMLSGGLSRWSADQQRS